MTRALAVALVLLAGTAAPSRAQIPLTREQAVAEALAGNRALAAQRSSTEQARAGMSEARSGWLPRITVSESWQRGNQPVFVFSSLLSARRFAASNFAIDALNHPDPVGFFRTTVGFEQLIFDDRQRVATTSASLRHDLASYAVDQRSADLVLSVTQAFGRVLAAQAAQRVARTGTESAREDLAHAERRRDVGMATEADVLSLRVHVADLEQRAIQAGGDLAVAVAELNHLTAAPIDRQFVAVEPAFPGTDSPKLDRAALVAQAIEARPELRSSDVSKRLADVARQGARAALIPSVAAQASVDVSGTSFADRASSWVFGGELRWSFSTGGAELARLKQAAEAASQARMALDEARSNVEVEVVSAINRLEAARARQAVGAASVDQARESQRIVRDRFEAGLAGVDDVLRASAALVDAEAQKTNALVDVVVGDAMLDRAVGRAR